jgi:hypothetical protein
MATLSRTDFITSVVTASEASTSTFEFQQKLEELVDAFAGPDVVGLLAEKKGDQTLATFADSIGCSASYVSDVLNHRASPGPKIYAAVDVEKPNKRWR